MASITGLSIEKKQGYIVIRLPNMSNQDKVLDIEEEIMSSLEEYGSNIVIDLSECANIYSMLITLMIHIRKKVVAAGGTVCLVNVSINGQKQLTLMNLDMILPIFETEKDIDFNKVKMLSQRDN